MKRRTFLTASGTVGIAGAVSGASVVSSVFTSINTSVLLEEFDTKTKSVFEKFTSSVAQNIQSLGLDEKIAKDICMPKQIITKKFTEKQQSITYKNRSGEYISLSVSKGVERIEVSKSI